MNDLETSLLSSRLDRLADDLAPQVDVVDQVRLARSRHRRQRRARLAVVATVAATITVVGVPTAISALTSAQARHGQTAHPGVGTPTTTQAPSDRSTTADRLKAAQSAAEELQKADQSLALERLRAAQSAAEEHLKATATTSPRTGG